MLLKNKYKNFFLIAGFVLLWNTGFIGAEYGLPYAGIFSLLFYRYLVLTVILFIFLNITKSFYWPGWRSVRNQMLIGVLAHGIWLACVLNAIEYGVPAGIVALVAALQPLATGALSGPLVGEPTRWNRWLGLLIGFSGVALPIISRINFHDLSEIAAWLSPLGSVAAITIANLFQRKISLRKDSHAMQGGLSLFYQSLATTLAVVLPAVIGEGLSVNWNPTFTRVLIWLIFGVSLGAYSLMWILIDRFSATKVASLFYLGPPVTMLMAWATLGDKPKIIDLTGIVLVFTGVFITYLKFPVSSNYMKRQKKTAFLP
ncbi:MAG: DMT family transporter [Fibrobacterota bacterium]